MLSNKLHNGMRGKDPSKHTGPNTPLLLLCGHTFCERCMTKAAKSQTTQIECPLCKKVTPLLDGEGSVKSLWPDIYILGVLAFNRRQGIANDPLRLLGEVQFAQKKDALQHSVSQEACNECGNRAATCLCIKCDSKLCSICFDEIHKGKTLRKHKAVPLLDGASDLSTPAVCDVHEQPIEYYCELDGQQICSKCIILGDHKEHPVSTLEEKNKTALENLDPLLKDAEKMLKVMRKSNKVVSSTIPTVQSGASQLVDDIRATFASLHGALQVREILLVQEVMKLKDAKIAPLEETRSKLLEESKKLEYAVSSAEKLLAGTVQTTLSAQTILSKLSAASSFPCCALSLDHDAEPQDFRFNFSGDLLRMIKEFGELEALENHRIKMCGLDDMPRDYMDDELPTPTLTPSTTPDSSSIVSASDAFDTESMVSGTSEASSALVRGRKEVKRHRTHTSKKEMVYVSHIKNPGHFTVQRLADMERLKSLSKAINRFCNGPSSDDARVTAVDIGELVLGRFDMDKNWYRAKVTAIHTHAMTGETLGADLYYIDYGNSENVPIDRIRAIQDRFLKLPEMALTCALYDVIPNTQSGKWEPQAVESFARMTEDKPMLMTSRAQGPDVLEVDLSRPPMDDIEDDRPVSMRDALIFLELALFPSGPGGLGKVDGRFLRRYCSPQLPMKGEKVDVMISHASSPDSFYVQLMREASYVEDLMSQLQTHYSKKDVSDLYTIYVPQKEMICVAEYSEDSAWYRAIVSELPGRQQVVVTYVDFGNKEMLPHFKLKKIPDKFAVLPMQAIECELADVKPIVEHAGWSEQALQLFAQASARCLEMEVRRVSDDNRKLTVALRDVTSGGGVCLNSLLVQYGLAQSTGPVSMRVSDRISAVPKSATVSAIPPEQLPVAKPKVKTEALARHSPSIPEAPSAAHALDTSKPPLVEVVVSHVENPGHFYIQLSDAGVTGLDVMMMGLNRTLRNTKVDKAVQWDKGDFCAALYSADKLWYRATIENIVSPHLQVHMIDFGFKDVVTADSLRPLEDKFATLESASVRCHLAGVQPAGDTTKWSQTSVEFFRRKVAGQTLFIAPSKSETEGESQCTDLLLEERIKGDALTPDQKNYVSLAEELKEKGLALPLSRRTSGISPAASISSRGSTPIPSVPTAVAEHAQGQNIKPKVFEDSVLTDAKQGISTQVPDVIEQSTSYVEDTVRLDNSTAIRDSVITNGLGREDPDVGTGRKAAVPDVDVNEGLSDYPPPDLGLGQKIQVAPTYVDYDGCIHAQVVYPDHSPQGRFGQLLKENSITAYVLDQVLTKANMYRAKIIRDGNSLFRCVAHHVLDDQGRHMDVRLGTLTYISDHWELFKNWFGITDKALYIHNMKQDGACASEREIRAVCFCYNVQITVTSCDLRRVTSNVLGKAGQPLIRLCYTSDGGDEHYDLILANETDAGSLEAEYSTWRENKIIQFKLEPPVLDSEQWEDSLVGQLMLHLQIVYKDSQAEGPNDWQAGQLCVCVYTDDQRYYRAIVEAVSPQGVQVNYVDFGNSEVVDPCQLRRQPFLVSIPRQCIKLALDGIQPVNGSTWKVESLFNMHSVLIDNGGECSVDIKGEFHGYLVVDVRLPSGADFAEHLIDLGIARKDPTKTAVIKSNVVFQPPSVQAPGQAVVEYSYTRQPASSNATGSHYEAPQPRPEQDAASNASSGSRSSRSTLSSRVTVESARHSASHLKPEPFASGPSLAAKVTSSAPGDGLSASQSESSLIGSPHRQTPVGGAEEASRDSSLERGDVSDKSWAEQCEDEASLLAPPPARLPKRLVPTSYAQLELPEVGVGMPCSVTYVERPDQMYIQHVEQRNMDSKNAFGTRVNEDLKKLYEGSTIMNDEYEFYPPLENPSPGMICCAQWSLDGAWYRAEVLEVVNGYVGVMFVDYGSREFVTKDRVKDIPKDLFKLPAQCTEVRVHGVKMPESGWPEDLTEKLCSSLQSELFIGFIWSKTPEVSIELFDFYDYDEAVSVGARGTLQPVSRSLFPPDCLVEETRPQETDLLKALRASGDVTQGDVTRGNMAQGDVTQGDVTRGNMAQGDATREDTAQGDATQEDTAQGDATQENTAQGDATREDTAQGDATQDNTAQGDATWEDTAQGDAEQRDSDSGASAIIEEECLEGGDDVVCESDDGPRDKDTVLKSDANGVATDPTLSDELD